MDVVSLAHQVSVCGWGTSAYQQSRPVLCALGWGGGPGVHSASPRLPLHAMQCHPDLAIVIRIACATPQTASIFATRVSSLFEPVFKSYLSMVFAKLRYRLMWAPQTQGLVQRMPHASSKVGPGAWSKPFEPHQQAASHAVVWWTGGTTHSRMHSARSGAFLDVS